MSDSEYKGPKAGDSRSRSNRSREPSPEASSTANTFQEIRINSSIFEPEPMMDSGASRSGSKSPREPSPDSPFVTTVFPALRINSNIFESEPSVEDGSTCSGSKGSREPSPENSSSATVFPALRINSRIFESEPSIEDGSTCSGSKGSREPSPEPSSASATASTELEINPSIVKTELVVESEASSNRSKRPREPSPEPSSAATASPELGINPSIVKTEPIVESEASSNRSKRPREPSPEPSSTVTASPALQINRSIFETGAEIENVGEDSHNQRNGSSRDSICRKKSSSKPSVQQPPSSDCTPVKTERPERPASKNPGPAFEREEVDLKPQCSQDTIADSDGGSLLNFFHGKLPKVSPIQRKFKDEYEPKPKMPRVAHYRRHDPEDEVKYVEELRSLQSEVIPVIKDEDDVDSEDESFNEISRLPRAFRQKEEVFSKFDFQKRVFSTDHLASHKQKDKIIAAIDKNRVVIVDGFTGCGKTTQVPQFIIDHAFEQKRPCNVIVTQPRRLAATAVARRICDERGWDLGTVVGYQVGMDKKTTTDTLVTFVTTGVLLQNLIRTRSLRQWSHIIIDEVHERDLHTDLLLLFIKKILLDDVKGRQQNVKLILMSATLNSRQFSEYFKTANIAEAGQADETPVVKIPTHQRKFQIEELFLDQLISPEELDVVMANLDLDKAGISSEMYQYGVKAIVGLDDKEMKLAKTTTKTRIRGSVLVFLPGIIEIKTMKKLLDDENQGRVTNNLPGYDWDILPLHSSITNEEQSQVFRVPVDYRRKIILSTNIAESSITVPDIVYVMDFCLTKANCVDSRTNFSSLRLCWASINQCIQRKGRTGRVGAGEVLRMVPRKFFGSLAQEAAPEMQKSALEHVVLQVKTLNMGSPQEILCLALDPPEVSGIERAVANLKEVGAMTITTTVKERVNGKWMHMLHYDTCDGDVTFLGNVMAALPISPQCTRLVMLGHSLGVLKEAIIIAAGLSSKNPFSTPFDKQLESYLRKFHFAKNAFSDCFAILYAYLEWQLRFDNGIKNSRTTLHERQWCRQWFIQLSQMREISNLVEELETRLEKFGIIGSSEMDVEQMEQLPKQKALMLKIAICGAFYPHYFQPYEASSSQVSYERFKDAGANDVFSTVYYRNFPTGNNRQHNGKVYAKIISDELTHALSVPCVKVEGQKVYAIFDGPGKKIGPIYESVYRAVKKRQLRHQLEFTLVSPEQERAELQRHEALVTRRKERFHVAPKQTELPPIACVETFVHVTHVESPSQFWVVSQKHKQFLDEMENDIKVAIEKQKHSDNLRQPVFVNALFLAPYFVEETGETLYYRATVQAVGDMNIDRQCLVYFIDYGNSSWIDMSRLKCFTPEICAKNYHVTPALAVECRLSETKPAVVHGSIWVEEALKKFRHFVKVMQLLKVKIYAVDKSVVYGELINSAGYNINDILKDGSFADSDIESLSVRMNNKARSMLLNRDGVTNAAQMRAHNDQQKKEHYDRDFLTPPDGGRSSCKLKGPFSPLELEFQSLCNSSSSKSVTIDGHSVNSVILDQATNTLSSRLLVASTINIHDKSGSVVARETTLMPSIPGLLGLMALIFAPRAELRSDSQFRSYTGVLCGLGTDGYGEPVYMDHDLEVVFDTVIDDEDIKLINDIRYDLNVCLREESGSNRFSTDGSLAKNFMRLLKRSRPATERLYPQESYVWGKVPATKIVRTSRKDYPIYPLDIFVPHDTIQLKPDAPDLMQWNLDV